MSAIAAIHVAKKQLGLDDDTARDVYERLTGKRSLREMSEVERRIVIEHFRRQGFKPASKASAKPARRPLEGKYAPILQALWIAGWNLGVVDNREDAALIAFVKRQAKVDHVRFLHDPADARSAIEGMKGWLERKAGVDWSKDRLRPDWTKANGYRIAFAQFSILKARNPEFCRFNSLRHWLAETRADRGGACQPELFDDEDWQAVMNALGRHIRKGAA